MLYEVITIKAIESRTNHDVKAVEYFLKQKLDTAGISEHKEWIHFGLTSQDINNTAVPVLTMKAVEEVLLPALENCISTLSKMASDWQDTAMLAHTHGQPATPTTMGKEMAVFAERLSMQAKTLKAIRFYRNNFV